MGALIERRILGEALSLEFFEVKGGLAAGTLRAIYNAWIAAAIVDQRGAVWVRASKLHTILRTTKPNARYLLNDAPKRDIIHLAMGKRKTETLVRGTRVGAWVDETIQRPTAARTSKYLGYSEEIYRRVRDHPEVRELRADFLHGMKSAMLRLKKKRIKRLKLTRDELTGSALVTTAQFSHIRAVSAYFELADKDWNGVVVNPQTHSLITAADVLDENTLKTICRKHKWNLHWVTEFQKELIAHEATGLAS